MNKIQWFLSYKGRLSRLQFFLYYSGASLILGLLLSLILATVSNVYGGNNIDFVISCFLLFCLYTLSCLVAKRFHDLGKSSWTVLWYYPVGILNILGGVNSFTHFMEGDTFWLSIAIIVLPIAVLLGMILTFRKGTVGENKYGEDPLRTISAAGSSKVKLHNVFEETRPISKESNVAQVDVKYCRNCGIKNIKDAKFCGSCGNSFT